MALWRLIVVCCIILVSGCSTDPSTNNRQACEMLDSLSVGPDDPDDPEGFERAIRLADPYLRERLRTVAAESAGKGSLTDAVAAYKDVLRICAAEGVSLP